MKHYRTSNKNARHYVQARDPFKGSHTFGEWNGKGMYVAFSYGRHFPLFLYNSKEGKWYANGDKYSVSTTRHFSLLAPALRNEMVMTDTRTMQAMAA